MYPLLVKVVVLGVVTSCVFAGSAIAASPKAPVVGAKAYLSTDDRTLLAAGKTPSCEFGSSISIKVRVRQAGRFARGSWKAGCVGPRLAWHVDLRPKLGRFKPGIAKVMAVSTVKKGKTVVKRRVSRRVKLKVGRGSPLGDYRIIAGITVTAPPGITVWFQGGGTGKYGSNCTSDETTTSVTPEGGTQRVVVGYNAKTGGSCNVEDSWSNFKVWLYGKGRGDTAYFYLGQHGGMLGSRDYEATCFSGYPSDVVSQRLNMWFDLRHCQKTDVFELKISYDDR